MKVRTDFVTNSSSSSYTIAITLTKGEDQADIYIDPTDEYLGGGGQIRLRKDLENLKGVSNTEELLTFIEENLVFEDADCAFEEHMSDDEQKEFREVYNGGYSIAYIRQFLEKHPDIRLGYFRHVLKEFDEFKEDVKNKFPDCKEIENILVSAEHSCWGEFTNFFDYIPFKECDTKEEYIELLKNFFTSDNLIDEAADVLMDYCEPSSFTCTENQKLDFKSNKVTTTRCINDLEA